MKRPPNRIGGPLSVTFERELQRALAPMVRQVKASAPQIATEADAKKLGAVLRRTWSDKRIAAIVAKIADKVERAASKGWPEPKKRVDGADAIKGSKRARTKPYDRDSLLERWAKEAVGRITSVRDEVAEAMRIDIVAAAKSGLDPADLAAKWVSDGVPVLWGTLEGRTKVIAQHQLAVLHADVQRERASALGVTAFIWRTQGDSRVRKRHRELEGKQFDYKDPPKDQGLPGHPVNCRCWAESVISDEVYSELLGEFGIAGTIEPPKR